MKNMIAIGTTTFALTCVVFGVIVQAAADLAGAQSPLPGQIATFLVAVPLAIVAGRRVGHLTHLSALVASVLIAIGALWSIVFMLNAIEEPAGGHVGWTDLFNAMNLRNTVIGSAATLVVPQAWLWLLNRLAANNSFKPKPLRGSA